MIKTMTAQTAEVDNVDAAVEQIRSQLGPESELLKNTIGIITCHYEFVYSGILKGICETLPYDVVGTISSGHSSADEHGILLFTIMVITSDDVWFEKTLTPSLMNDPGKIITESYLAAVSGQEKPALLLAFAPFLLQNSGDDYVNTLSRVSEGVPCFGTVAVDDTLDFSNCFMLSNGEHYRDKMAMVMVYGNLQPKFFIANISKNRMLEKSVVVTKSSGHILMEVNDRPIMEYFEDLGLANAAEKQYALTSLPFLLDYNDGTPMVSKIFVMMTPEKHALCAGAMPEGSTLHITTTDKNDVLSATGEAVDLIFKDIKNSSCLLIYSCIGRSMAFGSEQFCEIDLIKKKIGDTLPFLMAFSGGEICPTQVLNKKATNRFHNNAFVACLF